MSTDVVIFRSQKPASVCGLFHPRPVKRPREKEERNQTSRNAKNPVEKDYHPIEVFRLANLIIACPIPTVPNRNDYKKYVKESYEVG